MSQFLRPDGTNVLDDLPTAREAYPGRFAQFVENVANGQDIQTAGIAVGMPQSISERWWADVCRDLGPQAV